MNNNFYLLVVAYDGTNYQGWQEQKDAPTIAGMLKKSFKNIFKQEISIAGASRTDAGVHAKSQVARIKTVLALDPEQMRTVWNRELPEDIVIQSIKAVNEQFHPQHNVLQKTYTYKILTQKPSPFIQRYGLFYEYSINLDKLKRALKLFIGTHDFRSFCTGYEMDSTIRTIDSISVKKFKNNGQGFIITFKGKSFLRYMIRRIVGACLEISSKKHKKLTILKKALAEKNPEQHLMTAPAKGLTLETIMYKDT